MTRRFQGAMFLAVALIAATAGFLLSPFAGAPKLDTSVLLATSLPDLQGERRQVGEWRGKVLVVNFWATWCPPCLEEIPELVRMQARLGSSGLQVVGIAIDSAPNVREFARANHVNYPLLIGSRGGIELFPQLGNLRTGLPYTIVLDREGHVLRTFAGPLTEATLMPLVSPALHR